MKKYNFIDILTSDITLESDETMQLKKIEIPMIQRDYAQGRTSESEIRKRFLNAIFKALSEDTTLNMDFVYGSVSEDKNFIPLDGQQRLTTLFLLYWYIGSVELEDKVWQECKTSLKKFTYATRVSSRRFCEQLIEIRLKGEGIEDVVSFVKNQAWFYNTYQKDPTVQSMLNMIAAIAQEYQKSKVKFLWERLKNLQFYLLPLNGFNLTEELYVKMNARGKQLTDFENFKAGFIKWMQKELPLEKREFKGLTINYDLAFSQKIDNDWTPFFWDIINPETRSIEGRIVDPLYMKFFYRYLFNENILSPKTNQDLYTQLDEEQKFQNFEYFQDLFSVKLVGKIERILDNLVTHWQEIRLALNASWGTPFDLLDLKKPTLRQRVLFGAVVRYLEGFDYDNVTFKQWMRVIWNLVENTDINKVETMITTLKIMDKLSRHANEIYKHLADNRDVLASRVGKEEIEKAVYICNDERWEKLFIEAERHLFFKGCIGFMLGNNLSLEQFEHRRDLAFKVFDNFGISNTYRDNHLLLRAIISKFSTHDKLINKKFSDKGEILKQMLVYEEVAIHSIQKWLDLADQSQLQSALESAVKADSKMTFCGNLSPRFEKAHETLYKTIDLQKWMQHNGAVRVGWRNDCIYVSRPSSWYDWVMIDTYRNKIITELLKRDGYTTNHQCGISDVLIPYFWGNDAIEVKTVLHGKPVKYIFNIKNTLQLNIEDNLLPEEYDYQKDIQQDDDINSFLDKIEIKLLELLK